MRQYRIFGSRGLGGQPPRSYRFYGAPNLSRLEYFSQIIETERSIRVFRSYLKMYSLVPYQFEGGGPFLFATPDVGSVGCFVTTKIKLLKVIVATQLT